MILVQKKCLGALVGDKNRCIWGVRHSETSLLAGGILLFFFFLRLCSVPSLLRCGCDSLSHVYVQEVGYFGNPRHEEAQSRVRLKCTY